MFRAVLGTFLDLLSGGSLALPPSEKRLEHAKLNHCSESRPCTLLRLFFRVET